MKPSFLCVAGSSSLVASLADESGVNDDLLERYQVSFALAPDRSAESRTLTV